MPIPGRIVPRDLARCRFLLQTTFSGSQRTQSSVSRKLAFPRLQACPSRHAGNTKFYFPDVSFNPFSDPKRTPQQLHSRLPKSSIKSGFRAVYRMDDSANKSCLLEACRLAEFVDAAEAIIELICEPSPRCRRIGK